MTNEQTPEHKHQWQFKYTWEDWWDGDEEDVYVCTVEGCTERKWVYHPR